MIEGTAKLVAELRRRVAALKPHGPSVVVGYSAGYAVYVHENLEARHPVGQAKYLEEPARRLAPEIARVVREAMRRGATLEEALLLGGLRLQAESQRLCPVDRGFLRASAFTEVEQ